MNIEYPCVCIDLKKLRENAAAVTRICAEHGVEVAGVVKCCCGDPEVARAFAAGGVKQIADSRLKNLKRLREAGIRLPLWLLRLPMPSEIAAVVQYADLSLNSAPETLEKLSAEALRQRKIHHVLLMVDLGDRREGVLPGDAPAVVAMIRRLRGLYLAGIGANLTCFGGILPDAENMALLAEIVRRIQKDFHTPLRYVSAGNSSSVGWVMAGKMPPEINHLRLGEALLLGRETAASRPLPGTCGDAFTLCAEVIEAAVKPSLPEGTVHIDAFGNVPHFTDRGIRRRVIFGIGREDVAPEGLTPCDPGVKILGASSDHLIADVEESTHKYVPGDTAAFRMNYGALLAAMTSAYVAKHRLVATEKKDRTRELIGAEIISDAVNASARGAAAALLKRCERELNCRRHDTAASERELNRIVGAVLRAGKSPVAVGGDGTVLTALDGVTGRGLVVFSAFGDFNDEASGGATISGMSLAALCGHDCGEHFHVRVPFPEKNIVHIGLRSADRKERQRLRDSELTIFTMEQLDLLGMREVMTRALAALRDTKGLIAAISMSALDPGENPGATQSAPAGLSLREMYCALELLADSGRIVGALLYDCANQPEIIGTATALLAALFGKKII